jgi:vitamin B12 transporter
VRYLPFHIALILSALPLVAQEPLRRGDTLKLDTVYHAREIVVEGEGIIPRLATSTRPLSVISRAEIQASGARDLADAITFAPGVFVRQYGGIGGLRSVSLRGTSMQQTIVLIDGVRYQNSAGGGVDLGIIPADAIERVEIVRGGDAALYGANALGGVINIVTRRGDTGAAGSIAIRAGSFGELEGVARAAGRAGEHRWDLMLEARRADGDYPFLYNEYGQISTVRRQNADLESLSGAAGWRWRGADGKSARITTQAFINRRGAPGAIVQGNREQINARLDEREIFTIAQAGGRIDEWRWILSTSGRLNALHYRDPDARLTGPEGIDNRYDRSEGAGALKLGRTIGEIGSVEASGEITYGQLVGNNLDPKAGGVVRRTGMSGALLSHWFFEDLLPSLELTLDGGLRLDWFSDLESGISPSLGFSIHLHDSPFRLRGHAALAFRAPSFSEQYYLNYGNTDLRPERSRSVDLGITWQPLGTMLLESTFFLMETEDQIVAVPRSPVTWSATNIGRTVTRGMEMSLAGEMLEGLLWLRGSYTRMRAEDRSGGDVDGYLLVYTPEELLNGIVEIRTERLRIGVNGQYVSHRHTLPLNPADAALPHYFLAGFTAGTRWEIASLSLDLRAEVSNLFDAGYQVIRNYPMPGRAFRVGIEVGGKSRVQESGVESRWIR